MDPTVSLTVAYGFQTVIDSSTWSVLIQNSIMQSIGEHICTHIRCHELLHDGWLLEEQVVGVCLVNRRRSAAAAGAGTEGVRSRLQQCLRRVGGCGRL